MRIEYGESKEFKPISLVLESQIEVDILYTIMGCIRGLGNIPNKDSIGNLTNNLYELLEKHKVKSYTYMVKSDMELIDGIRINDEMPKL